MSGMIYHRVHVLQLFRRCLSGYTAIISCRDFQERNTSFMVTKVYLAEVLIFPTRFHRNACRVRVLTKDTFEGENREADFVA